MGLVALLSFLAIYASETIISKNSTEHREKNIFLGKNKRPARSWPFGHNYILIIMD